MLFRGGGGRVLFFAGGGVLFFAAGGGTLFFAAGVVDFALAASGLAPADLRGARFAFLAVEPPDFARAVFFAMSLGESLAYHTHGVLVGPKN